MERNVVIPVVLSTVLHAVVITVAYIGLPSFDEEVDVANLPINVELVTVSDVTNLPTKPKQQPKAEAKPAPAPPPKPPAPPPAPLGSVEEPPAPPPAPEPEEEKVAVLPAPDTKPKKEAKPKPEPKDEPKKTETKKAQPAPLPPRKPKPPDEFQSVLKTLEQLQKAPPPKKDDAQKDAPSQMDFTSMMENALESDRQRLDIGPELTISEIDLVKQQIRRCWNLPAGAKDAHTMQISIRVAMNPDGTVRTARILDSARMASDPFYRAMAESAFRAVLNPACQPFKLPPEKYARWKDLKLNFDPKEMFGL